MNFPSALDPIRSIKDIWRSGVAAPGPLLGWWFAGLACLFAIYVVFYIVVLVLSLGSAMTGSAMHDPSFPLATMIWIFSLELVFILVMMAVVALWQSGLGTILIDVQRTGRGDFARGWEARSRAVRVFLTTLLGAGIILLAEIPIFLGFVLVAVFAKGREFEAPMLVGAMALALGWMVFLFYVALGIVFAVPAAIVDGCGPVEAVRRSWRAARGHRLAIVWFYLVLTLAALAGCIALCVGYLVTIAFVYVAPIEAYVALTRAEERKSWWIETGVVAEPPAPAL